MILYIILEVVILIGIICYLFPFVRVVGDSMLPTYNDGQLLPAMRMTRFMPLYDGRVYVYVAPEGRVVIKRLMCHEDGICYFLGDNSPVSHDSRDYGYIDRKNIIAIVL